ncbi:hypothetical protein BDV09DRAFT_179253 [Aspergillus tetrazonus]
MLCPLFVDNEEYKFPFPTFHSAFSSMTLSFRPLPSICACTMEKSLIGIPPVRPGDRVFWHCDLIHEVDKFHPGKDDSDVAYYLCTPLAPYH